MNTPLRSLLATAALAGPLLLIGAPAAAQNANFAAGKDGGPPACSLIQPADVQKATGRKEFFPPEQYPYPDGATVCSVAGAELVVWTGADSWNRLEKLLAHKRKDDPRKRVAGIGERAFVMFPQPRNSTERMLPQGLMFAQRGRYTVSLAVDAAPGQPLESTEPALVALMKAALGRLP